MGTPSTGTLNILHVMRAPVGGLFRHVLDLARGQIARGHRVGLIADTLTGGTQAEATLAALAPSLALGLSRVAMSRHVGANDIAACTHVAQRAAATGADVVHGHGAKGGAYARLARADAIRVYTPHGGSLHYDWRSPTGFLYLASERAMMRRTDLFLFESAYGRDAFRAKIGDPGSRAVVVHNGVAAAEFAPIVTAADASDIVFVGELRLLKGVDVLIAAIAALRREGVRITATIVGDGPDRAAFEASAREVAPESEPAIAFVGAKPARTAFALGRLLAIPSRAESLPYIVLEAGAAGVPMITTRVGGIPEIYGSDAGDLVPPGNADALARAIGAAMDDPSASAQRATRLQRRIRDSFSVDVMTEAVLAAYRKTLAHKALVDPNLADRAFSRGGMVKRS
jgi:glycosyltransferase involved in cell wall biosynthesis